MRTTPERSKTLGQRRAATGTYAGTVLCKDTSKTFYLDGGEEKTEAGTGASADTGHALHSVCFLAVTAHPGGWRGHRNKRK